MVKIIVHVVANSAKSEVIMISDNEFKELQKSIKEKIKYLDDLNKVIVVLHKKDKKTIWSLTCMLTSLKITSLSIDAKSGKLLEEKSANISDYIKVDKG